MLNRQCVLLLKGLASIFDPLLMAKLAEPGLFLLSRNCARIRASDYEWMVIGQATHNARFSPCGVERISQQTRWILDESPSSRRTIPCLSNCEQRLVTRTLPIR